MTLADLGKTPVSGEKPAGSDIRYDPLFEELQAEVDKLSSPTATGTLDWGKVAKVSTAILSDRSKDLLAAAYLAVSLIHTRKAEGLAIGLRLFRDLLENFWEDLFPPKARMRGRLGALEWWAEKSENAIALMGQGEVPSVRLHSIREDLEAIDRFLGERLEEAPSVRPLLSLVDSLEAAEPEEAAAPAGQTSPGTGEPLHRAAPASARETLPVVASPEDAQKVLAFAVQKAREVAAFFRGADLSNPVAYHLSRWAAWSRVEAVPPAPGGRTAIPPPPPHLRTSLHDLQEKGTPEALVQAVEAALSQSVFWLDLGRWSAEALVSLGDRYGRAHEAVCKETSFLLQRLPGLEDLSFSDGSPFADGETRQWLLGILPGTSVAPPAPAGSGGTGEEGTGEDAIGRERERARRLIRKGKLSDAVEVLQQGLRNSFSRKERLLWRLALADLLVQAKLAKLALSHLEPVLQDIDEFHLEEYEPEVALRGLKLVFQVYRAHADKVYREKAAETLNRIGRIDLAEVIRLEKEK